MADQLALSYWLRGVTEHNLLRHYEKVLRAFPYSRLSPGFSTLRVHAVAETEPPVLEKSFPDPLVVDDVLAALKEFPGRDVAYFLDSRWDLWQFDGDWHLQPSRVTLAAFGPEFERDLGEDLRIDFGVDLHYLPQPEFPESLTMVKSNVKSLLHLVHDLDNRLAVERRQLWTESGENFADRLQRAIA